MDAKEVLVPIIVIPLAAIILLTVISGADESASESNSETMAVGSYGSAIQLQKAYVETGTESVTNVTGDVLLRDTDYTMDYNNGRITFLG